MKEALLGLDVGTSSTKALLFDEAGAGLASSTSPPYRNQTPHPGWVEQDPEALWQAVLSAVRGVMAQVGKDVRVRALCMAAQSGSLLPVDAGGRPAYPLITWMDGRTERLAQQWREEGIGEQIKSISGWSLHPGLCLLTVAWLRQHDPATFAAARRYFSVNDFIAHRLTGQACTNPSNAGGMHLADVNTGRWSEALCALAGISPEQLSPIRPSGAIIGEMTPDACRATGLPAGTVLVNGGHDQGCTALGLGVTAPGKVLLACGTAWVITGVTDGRRLSHLPEALDVNFHPAPGRWTISRSLGGLGASLEWWVQQAWRGIADQVSRPEMYAALDEALARTKPGCGGLFFLPLTGGHDDPGTTRPGGFVGLQLGHTRADMARAILEGAAFELRWALDNICEVGLPVEKMWMVGGAAGSPFWPRILADVTGVPMRLPLHENWPALGAAVLAGVGSGLFTSLEDGLARFRKPAEDVLPDERLSGLYDESFESYKRYAQDVRRQPDRSAHSRRPHG